MALTPDARSLLRVQLVLAGLGAAVWYTGVVLASDFAAGAGVGMLVSALALRLLKRRS